MRLRDNVLPGRLHRRTTSQSRLDDVVCHISRRIAHNLSVTASRHLFLAQHAFRTQTPLHPQLLLHPLHQTNGITAQQHLDLSVAILEKLIISQIGPITEHIHKNLQARFQEV